LAGVLEAPELSFEGAELVLSFDVELAPLSFDSDVVDEDALVGPFADELEARESVMYQPLPLKTMPTGWMTLRRVPPHCSHVVNGGSEKLWRFSITSLQAVQV
jgi:hypothetical protein